MSQGGAYYLRRQPGAESFREAWTRALDLGVARVEDVVMDRALNGVEEPLYSFGKHIGTRRRYNDRLLMFILRNRAPERFADGRPKGLNAIDQMQIDRLKKKWRREWEAEQERENVDPAEVRRNIDKAFDNVRRRLESDLLGPLDKLSDEARDAWAHFKTLRDRDRAAAEKARKMRGGEVSLSDYTTATPPPKKLPPPPAPPKTQWTVMDESFDP